MQADVISTVNEAAPDDFFRKTVIVIDVLRATSTIVTALAHGCKEVVPVETVQQARERQRPGDLLGGERFCQKIEGFDYGNSPLEYRSSAIFGKRVVLTTTNGTRAIQKYKEAAHVIAGSMLNAEACIRAAIELDRDLIIVCSGTRDMFSLEDSLCAGLLLEKLAQKRGGELRMNDLGAAMRLAYRSANSDLGQTLLTGANGKRLSEIGYRSDVIFCSQADRYDTVPILKEQSMIVF